MKEFITHYLNQGVDHFIMIDNDSNDNYMEYLKPYDCIDVVIEPEKHAQVKCYNKYKEKCKQYDWVIVCDMDEFIYARKEFKTIKEYLHSLDKSISQVLIPWKLFGSNGYNTIEQTQPSSVIKTFTKRMNYDKKEGFQGVIQQNGKYSLTKSIVRTADLIEFSVHCHRMKNKSISTDFKNDFIMDNKFSKIDEIILENSYLHLNHYAIQSLEWFMRIKATRGDISTENFEHIRNETYFRDFDTVSNDIIDTELSTKSTRTLCIVACHTNSTIKIESLKKSRKYLEEIADDIIYINSIDFKNIPIFSMLYTNNTNNVCYEKYLHVLSGIDLQKYDNYILTNDSIFITRSLLEFKKIFDPSIEMSSFISSNEYILHYPDFLRRYNKIGIQKIISFYEENLKNQAILKLIQDIELKSHTIHESINVLYPSENGFYHNIHFDNKMLKKYIDNKYPILKIKKLMEYNYVSYPLFLLDYNKQLDNNYILNINIRYDLESYVSSNTYLNDKSFTGEQFYEHYLFNKYKGIKYFFDWVKYLDTYPDLRQNGIHTEEQAIWHWNNHGKQEGRQCYKNE
jgi:hypothetical protein